MKPPRLALGACGLAAALALGGSQSYAEPFPSKPVRLIVPSVAGSPPDVNARRLADKVAPALGRPVIVDNKPGAGGAIGMEAGARSAPDGHTLVFSTFVPLTVNPSLYAGLSYDPLKDFTPVMLAYRLPLILVVHPALPARSVGELVRLAKGDPGALFYGSAGNGTPPHVFMELFKSAAAIEMTHVPYKGGPAATAALVGADVKVGMDAPGQLLAQVRAGRLRALAVSGDKRIVSLRDVPTFAEAGIPGIDSTWSALVAPAGTPREIVERLYREFAHAILSQDLQAAFASIEVTPIAGRPEVLAKLMADEIVMWRELVRRAGITPG
jgi:tripartite-type tricarboxylate transporter receptor subunit TctC